MVKMSLASSEGQANSVKSLVGNRMGAYQSTMEALNRFIGTDSLKGQAYDNAKAYAESTLLPLLQAAILYEEDLSEAVGKIPSEYRNTEHLGGEDLDSAVLEEELNHLDMSRNSLMASIALTSQNLIDFPERARDVQTMRGQLRSLNTRREKILNQLTALSEYDGRSATFFTGLTDISSKIDSGIQMISSDMSGFTGGFPQRTAIAWAGEVTKRWKKREAALTALRGDDGLSEEEIRAISEYVALNGSGEKEILIYDNVYGYAKYTITIETNYDGSVSVSLNKGGIDSIQAGGVSLGEDGLTTSSKLHGSAIGSWGSTYTASLSRTGTPSASVKVGGEQSEVEIGVKPHNGQTASYLKSTTTVTKGAISASIAYEQGYYQRNVQAPPKPVPVAEPVNEVDWGKVGEVTSYVAIGTTVAIVGYFAWPFVVAAVGSISIAKAGIAIGSAILAFFISQ